MSILKNILILSLVFLSFGNDFKVSAQGEKTVYVLDSDEYDGILDKLFPKNAFIEHGVNEDFTLVLRYKPSFEAESQLIIVGRKDVINVVELTTSENVYYKLADVMTEQGGKEITDLSKHISVRKRELKIPLQQLNIWRKNLIESFKEALKPKVLESVLPFSGSLSQVDDGTSYQMWDSSLSGDIYFSPSSSEDGKRDNSGKRSFIKWMEEIRKEVNKRK